MKKKKPPSRVKEKLKTFFTQNCTSKGMSRKRVAHSDNIIVSLFTLGCCKVLSSLNVWEFFFNHKALVPLRRVNYYKHVKFDLRDNITSLDVTIKGMDLAGAGRKARYSGNSPQNPVLKTSRPEPETYKEKKGHGIGQWIWPGFPIFYKTPPKVKVEECCQSHLDSAL